MSIVPVNLSNHYREVEGELVAQTLVEARTTRLEVLRRKSNGVIAWRFRQPRPALFWYRRGIQALHLDLNGSRIHSAISAQARLAWFPASMPVAGEFEVDACCDYVVIFLDPAMISSHSNCRFDRPLIAFASAELEHGLLRLCQEARTADGLYELFAEGWAMQALAQLSRIAGASSLMIKSRGGLSASSLRHVHDYIAAELSRAFTIQDLAHIADLSPRHFMRAFRQSVGTTPLRFIQALRIDQAKLLLTDSKRNLTDIALACGFSHAQHFSTRFKQATGSMPSAFRKSSMR